MSNIHSTKRAKAVAIVEDGEGPVIDGDVGQAKDESGLTPRQAAFVRAFITGPTAGNGSKSCVVAGYSEKTAPAIQNALLKLPHIQAAIDAALREEIGTDLTIEAVRVIRKVITDESLPLLKRGDMAVKIVEFSGLVHRVQQEKAAKTGLDGTKPLGQMGRAELEALVRNGADLLKAAASLPAPGQVIDGGSGNNSAHVEPAQAE